MIIYVGIAVTSLGLCDYVFASTTSTYNTPFAALGQYPEGCSSYMFPKIMGPEVANEVLWKGRKLNAEEALKCGLVQELYPPDELLQRATAYCERLAAFHPKELKRFIVQEELTEKLQEVNTEECSILEKKWVRKECFEALANFMESRNMKTQATVLR